MDHLLICSLVNPSKDTDMWKVDGSVAVRLAPAIHFTHHNKQPLTILAG